MANMLFYIMEVKLDFPPNFPRIIIIFITGLTTK